MMDSSDTKEQDLDNVISSIRKIIERSSKQQYKQGDTAEVNQHHNNEHKTGNEILELTDIILSDVKESRSVDQAIIEDKISSAENSDQDQCNMDYLIENVIKKITEPLIEKWIENYLHSLAEAILVKKINKLFVNKK